MTVNDKIISTKLGLLNLAEELGNVSKACKVMGFSRDTFYRYKEAMETGGVDALLDSNRRRPNHKNRVDERTEMAAVALAIDNPALGQVRVSNELRKAGVFVSPGGVRSIWLRHDLETMKKRLFALEKKVAEDGLILTETQIAALEKKKEQEESGAVEFCGCSCGALQRSSLSGFPPFPIIIVGAAQNRAADIEDVLGSLDFPEHA